MADSDLHIARPTLEARQKTIMSSYAGWSAQRVSNELLSKATSLQISAGEMNSKIEKVNGEIAALNARKAELVEHRDELLKGADAKQRDAMTVAGLDLDAVEAG